MDLAQVYGYLELEFDGNKLFSFSVSMTDSIGLFSASTRICIFRQITAVQSLDVFYYEVTALVARIKKKRSIKNRQLARTSEEGDKGSLADLTKGE